MTAPTRATCVTCGNVHVKCTAHTRAKEPCGMNPADGANVCRMHGGAAPRARANAAKRVQERKVLAAVATYGLPVDIDPGTALLEEVSRTAGHVRWLHGIVQELDPSALTWGDKQKSHVEGLGPEGPVDQTTEVQSAGVNIWLELYLKERDHLRKVATDALKAGIAERQVQLAEQAGERAGQWLQACLAPLNLSEGQMRAVMGTATSNLHLLQGAG